MSSPLAHHRFRPWIFAGATLAVALVGLLDYEVPYEINLLMLYLGPVLVVAWYGNWQSSLSVAFLAAATTWIANLHQHPWSLPAYAWRGLNDTLCLVLIALGCSAARTRHDIMAARVKEMERTRRLEETIVRVSEEEQRRLGEELHDGICQQLAAISFAIQGHCLEIKGLSESAEKAAGVIKEQLAAVTRDARDLAHGIFPVQMTPEGFLAAFYEAVDMTNRLRCAPVRLVTSGEILVDDPQAATHLYRIAREALTNALKHAKSSAVEIVIEQRGRSLRMEIIDNGVGMAASPSGSTGIGLQTMAYRAQALGASFEVKPRPGGGTIVRCVCELPMKIDGSVPGEEERDSAKGKLGSPPVRPLKIDSAPVVSGALET